MKVPFFDLKRQQKQLSSQIEQAYKSVMGSGQFIGGSSVQDFEKNLADYYGVRQCIGVANGTDALFISLKILGIGSGDQVITSAFSYVATKNVIVQTGASPVFVDIDEFWNINVTKIEEKINSKTKAVLPVHLYGQWANMSALKVITDNHNLKIIEDAAQMHGRAELNNPGQYSDLTGISFYPTKQLGAFGDAGAILTNDNDYVNLIRDFTNHASQPFGINSRMDPLQAAFLSVKLQYLDGWIKRRSEIATNYLELLSGLPGITLPAKDIRSTWYNFVVQLLDRDSVQGELSNNGIETKVNYPYALSQTGCPKANHLAKTCLSLPLFPEMTDKEVIYVCDNLKAIID
jgi:dTDP-4-amino-4,6-dideoxygalactose transaminase